MPKFFTHSFHQLNFLINLVPIGASEGTRTLTSFHPYGPEPYAYAYFATDAHRLVYHYIIEKIICQILV